LVLRWGIVFPLKGSVSLSWKSIFSLEALMLLFPALFSRLRDHLFRQVLYGDGDLSVSSVYSASDSDVAGLVDEIAMTEESFMSAVDRSLAATVNAGRLIRRNDGDLERPLVCPFSTLFGCQFPISRGVFPNSFSDLLLRSIKQGEWSFPENDMREPPVAKADFSRPIKDLDHAIKFHQKNVTAVTSG
jgi:hypothetical protein